MGLESGLKALRKKGLVKASAMKKEFFKPQLAQLNEAPPKGADWIFETKFDGYRIIASKSKGAITLRSRNGLDWTSRFADVATALEKIPAKSFVIDGEMVALDEKGKTSFEQLQKKLSDKDKEGFVYFLFDIIYLDGFDLRELLLLGRKRLLEHLLEELPKPQSQKLRYSKHSEDNGEERFKEACKNQLEGIIAKNALSPYLHRRSPQWLKIKCTLRDEFVIGGFTEPGGSREHFGSLLLGAYDKAGNFKYVGKVGTGFDQKLLRKIKTNLLETEIRTSPFDNSLIDINKKSAHFVKPQYVAQIAYTERTRDLRLRHPVFLGLREDKRAREVIDAN
jgi:bifunctional non-homologous end joining protein LigD